MQMTDPYLQDNDLSVAGLLPSIEHSKKLSFPGLISSEASEGNTIQNGETEMQNVIGK